MRERILLEQSLMEEPNDTVFNHGFNGRVQNAMIFCWCTPRLAGVVLTASPAVEELRFRDVTWPLIPIPTVLAVCSGPFSVSNYIIPANINQWMLVSRRIISHKVPEKSLRRLRFRFMFWLSQELFELSNHNFSCIQ